VTRWRQTGTQEAISSQALIAATARFDAEVAAATRAREHYWLALVGFVVSPPMLDSAVLDHENIRVAPVVGCYVCEEPWTELTATRRCKGEPR